MKGDQEAVIRLFRVWHIGAAVSGVMLCSVIAILAVAVPSLAAEPIVGRATVIDGDTIEIRGQRIRLHGIDAPESRQLCKLDGKPWRCGKDAAFAVADKIGAANVRCIPRGRDKYKRVIAVCWLGDEDLNDWLVRNGWALAYQRYSRDYVGAENEAREHRRGIWRSEFIPPWEWRKKQRKRQTGVRGGSGSAGPGTAGAAVAVTKAFN